MKHIIKLSLISVLSASLSVFAAEVQKEPNSSDTSNVNYISEPTVRLRGYSHFQAAYRSQNHLTKEEKKVSFNRNSMAFYNDTAVLFEASNEVKNIKYGCQIALVPTAKRSGSPNYNGSNIYFETDFGKLEVGSPIPSASKMRINAGSITVTPDDWDRYAKFNSEYLKQNHTVQPTFATFSQYFLDSKLTTSLTTKAYSTEPARSVSYYTPKFKFSESTNIQLGLTYIPDSSNTGADSPDKNSSGVNVREVKEKNVDRFEINRNVKNAISAGIKLETNISDGVDFTISLTGEAGKAAGEAKKFKTEDDQDPEIYKISNLKTYNIGAILSVGNFSYEGSFGSLGNSLTTAEFYKTGRKTNYYTCAVAYNQGPFGASVSYFKSSQFRNDVNAVTVGTSYLMAPGFKPYVELSGYFLKGKPEYYNNLSSRSTRGIALLAGVKLSI